MEAASEDRVTGVDVAGWQKPRNCDWDKAHQAGARFVIAKVSQGLKLMKSGLAHGLAVRDSYLALGGYHFADPRGQGKFQAVEQADVFSRGVERWAGLQAGDVKPWLDMEWISFGKTAAGKARGKRFRRQFPADLVMDWTDEWADRVQYNLGGPLPGVYTGRSFVKYRYRRDPRLIRFDLWLAAYVDVGPERDYIPARLEGPDPVVLRGGLLWPAKIWQWTGRGRVPFYRWSKRNPKGAGKIDRNLWLAGTWDFQRWLVGGDAGQCEATE